MNMRLAFTICLIFALPVVAVGSSSRDLEDYIRLYRETTLSRDVLEKIGQYEHLINYFTGFYYFSSRQKVSAEFLKALILAESGADPGAVSPKGAIGLGQILPATGRRAAHELAQSRATFRYVPRKRLAGFTREDLFDPAVNILLTCYLIAKYNYRYDGRLDLVLSAWNAGENTEALAEMRHAPYQETRNLIGKVNGYYLFLLKKRDFR